MHQTSVMLEWGTNMTVLFHCTTTCWTKLNCMYYTSPKVTYSTHTWHSHFAVTFEGYGNMAPKTPAGRMFCIFYGLFGVPLCLSWISELGKFFGGRAKHLGQYLTKKGLSLVSSPASSTTVTCTQQAFLSVFNWAEWISYGLGFLFFALSQRKAQFACTAIFVLWGVLFHLVLPPFVFKSQEGWTYVEGLYFSFITLTTIGFGDLVAGMSSD